MGERVRITVPVRYEPIEVLRGRWCTTCALPCAWVVTLAIFMGLRMSTGTRGWCPECRTHFRV